MSIFKNHTSNGTLNFPMQDAVKKIASELAIDVRNFEILQKLIRPFSIVLKIRLDIKNKKPLIVYLKTYHLREGRDTNSQLKREYETALFWHEKFMGSNQYRVVRPLYFDPEYHFILTKESLGFNLGDFLNKHGQFFPSVQLQQNLYSLVNRVGQWLSYFQSLPAHEHKPLINLEYLLDYIDIRINRILENGNIDFEADLARRIKDNICENWQHVTEEDKANCYVHRDLSLSNVLINKKSVTVLDFTIIDIRTKFIDLTRFYHQLMLLENKPTFQRSILRNLQNSFLEGFGDRDINQHPLFKIYMFIHSINHLGKTSRYWEHSRVENIYNHWIVRNSLKNLKKLV